jgi:hypothetical protein
MSLILSSMSVSLPSISLSSGSLGRLASDITQPPFAAKNDETSVVSLNATLGRMPGDDLRTIKRGREL